MGELFSRAVKQELQADNGATIKTVVEAWDHVYLKTKNKAKNFNARSLYWPECKNDTIRYSDSDNYKYYTYGYV